MFDNKKYFNPTIQKNSNGKIFTEIISSDETTSLIKPLNKSKPEQKWRVLIDSITIEPLLFSHTFALSLNQIISQNFFIDRICRVTLGYTDEVCLNLTRNVESDEITDDMRVRVDGLTSTFLLYLGIVNMITGCIMALFLGSWIDKHGNKLPLLLPLVGYTIQSILNIMFTFLPDLPPEYLLISSVPIALSGGTAAVILSTFSYIASVTTVENRSYRIALMEACWFFGMPVGTLVGARIYKDLGFRGVYITSSVINLCTIIYGLLFIRDKRMKFDSLSSCCMDMLNVTAVKDTFQTVFKKREGSRRMWVLLLIVSICFRLGTSIGPQNCLFLFTRYMFQWNEQEYSTFLTLEGLAQVMGILIVTVTCIKILKLSDPLVGIMVIVGVLASNAFVAFSPRGPEYAWIMYLSLVLHACGLMACSVIRSMLSKIVPQEEIGKIFTIVACGETSMPIFAGALYSLVFVNTEQYLPGAFSLLSLGLNSVIAITFAFFFIITRNNSQSLMLATYKSEGKKVKDGLLIG